MLKREFKINFKNMLIWTLICISLFLVAFIIYPSIITNESSASLNDMLKTLPEEMLKMFNMDISEINTVFGWFKTEGYTCIMLILGFYSAVLGSSIIVKEESDKTIEFLYSKPISKNKIVTSKLICSITYIVISVLLVAIFNFIGLTLSQEFDHKVFWLLSLSPLIVCIPLFLVTTFISTFFNKTKKTIGIALGLVFINYFIQTISLMSDKVEYFKYFSLFSLSDSRNIIQNQTFSLICLILFFIISIISTSLIYINYNKKEFI